MTLRIMIGAAIGLLLGAAVGQILKARGGTCPLTCNPIGGAIFGAVFGAILATSFGASARAGRILAEVPGFANTAEFDERLAKPAPMLVDFYTDNCLYCVKLAPTIAKLAEQYQDRADVVKVNTANAAELAQRYQIRGVPTVILFAGGKEVRRWVGVKPIDQYQAALDAAAGPAESERKDDL